MSELNFAEDVAIDLDDLHEEWRSHAYKRKAYADEVAFLDKQVKQQAKFIDVKKTNVKEATGNLILEIKAQEPKMTVQQVDATVAGHPQLKTVEKEYADAQNELINMEYDLNMAKNALKAMDDRKTALENEVILWSRDYFSTPREKREIASGKQGQGIQQEAQDKKTQTSRAVVNERRRRRGTE